MAQEAQQAQNLADRFFGGNLDKMLAFEKFVEQSKVLGSAEGLEKAYHEAQKYGFKGSLADFEKFQEGIHQIHLYGQNKAAVDAAKTTDESVYGLAYNSRYGGYLKSYAQGKAYTKGVDTYGLANALFAEENKELYEMGKGLRIAPSSTIAGKEGEWAGRQQYETYALNKSAFGTADKQTLMERASAVLGNYKGMLDTAIVTDSQNIEKTMNYDMANYLKTFGTVGSMQEATAVTDSETRYLSGSIKNMLQTERGRQMLADLGATLLAEAKVGTPFGGIIGDEASIKGMTQGEIRNKIDNALKSGKGIDLAENIIKTALQQKNFELAQSKPDTAFLEQKQYFDDLRSAMKSGDIDKASAMLGVSNIKEDLTHQYHQGAAPDRIVSDVYQDGKGAAKEYMKDLKETLHLGENKADVQKAEKSLDNTTDAFNDMSDGFIQD